VLNDLRPHGKKREGCGEEIRIYVKYGQPKKLNKLKNFFQAGGITANFFEFPST